jgi:D-alanine--poly(phosphoribitol) ligase subunit 1
MLLEGARLRKAKWNLGRSYLERHMNLNLACPFYAHAEMQPESAALRVDGSVYTYGELARRASAIAERLRQSVPAGPRRVVILGARSWESYAALLGVCWSGAAYVPVSSKLPVSRVSEILSIIQPDALLVDPDGARLAAGLPDLAQRVIFRVQDIHPSRVCDEPANVDPEDPAYILFTSGSTGVPKGVAIAFRGVAAFLSAMAKRFPLTPEDRAGQPCELSFDISVSNIFTAWGSAACVCVVPASQAMAPRDFLRNQNITSWFSTPSVAVFLEQMKMLRPGIFPALRYTLFGGEGLPATTADRWAEAIPNGILANIYGPTETSVACTSVIYTGAELVTPGRGIVSIGRPFEGVEFMLVDDADNVVAPGETGELLIGGPQVGIGYWNDHAMTSARFPRIDGKRWYRSGDMVYRDAGGLYHFISRKDNQVKVRGFRVELGEIEAHLRDICRSDSVAALPWPVNVGSAGGIVAFVSGTTSSPFEIRSAMKSRVPGQLVPDRIHLLDAMPFGATGKLDRKALTAMLEQKPGAGALT